MEQQKEEEVKVTPTTGTVILKNKEEYNNIVFENCTFTLADNKKCKVKFTNCEFINCQADPEKQKKMDFIIENCKGLNNMKKTIGKSIIGYKECYFRNSFGGYSSCLVKIRVPEDALRVSDFNDEGRCNIAKVLEIRDLEGNLQPKHRIAYDDREVGLKYKLGRMVEMSEPFEERPWVDQNNSIHFFIQRGRIMEQLNS